jgi:hypothetical protein
MKTILLSSALFTCGFIGAQIKSTEKQIIIEGKDTTTIIKDVLEGNLERQTIIQTEDKSIMTIEGLVDGTQKQMIIQGGDTTIIITKKTDDIYINEIGELKVDDKSDTTRIKLGKKNIVIVEKKEEGKNGEKKVIIDERVIIEDGEDSVEIEDDEVDEKEDRSREGHWAGFGGSANFFVTDNFTVADKEDALFLEIDFSRSASLNMNIYEKRFPIIKEYVGLTTGLGFQFSFYELKNNVDITVNSDSTFGTINLSNDFSTNRLQLFYLQVPLLLEFNTSKNPDKNWHLSFGVTGAFKMGASYLKKWKNDGEKYKDKMRSSFNMHPFQAYGTAIIGYGNYSLLFHYGLTSLFEKDKGPNFAPVSAGILLNF